MDSARAAGSSGGTGTASAAVSSSGMPPTALATMGTPAAIASNSTIGVPSVRELRTSTSNAASKRAASGTAPCHVTRDPTPISCARVSSAERSRPSPTKESCIAASIRAAAESKTSGPFSGESRPTKPTRRSSAATPSTLRASARGSGGSPECHAFTMVCSRSEGTPRRSSSCARSRETATTASRTGTHVAAGIRTAGSFDRLR